jgi:hypothetical protein
LASGSRENLTGIISASKAISAIDSLRAIAFYSVIMIVNGGLFRTSATSTHAYGRPRNRLSSTPSESY